MSFNQLGSSDVQTIATEVIKPWSLSYCDLINNGALKIYKGRNIQTPFNPNIDLRSHDVYERLIYHSINQVYYNQIDKSITTEYDILGDITFDNDYYKKPEYSGIIRNFPTAADSVITVFKFNKELIGDLIKPKSFLLQSLNYYISDDGNGNLHNTISDIKFHIGNIFYETGIAVITDFNYQNLFHSNPIAYNDTATFLFNQQNKIIYPLSNDAYAFYVYNSLTILNPDQYISVDNDKIIYTNNNVGTRVYFYKFKIDIGVCDTLESNVGQITIVNYNKSGVFDYTIESLNDYCDFDAVIQRHTSTDDFDYAIELLRETCNFKATVTDKSIVCGFDLSVLPNDSVCGFDLNIYLIGDIVPTPSVTPTISLTPSITPTISISASVGVTPTATRTSTPTPTPTPTKSGTVILPTPTPTPTRTPTPSPSSSSSNVCPQGPRFFGPLTNLTSTGVDVSYNHIGVNLVKWEIVDKNNPLNILKSGLNSPFFTSGLFDQIHIDLTGISGLRRLRIMGGNCGSLPDEIDINIPGGNPTPTPTPTSSPAPGSSPTPTPTPTKSPLATCKTYKVTPKPIAIWRIRYVDCNGATQIPSGGGDFSPVPFYICSLVTPTNEGDSNASIELTNANACDPGTPSTPTPTPTRTPTPTQTRTPTPSPSAPCNRPATTVYGHASAWGGRNTPNAPCSATTLFTSVDSIKTFINTTYVCYAGTPAWYTSFSVGGTVYQNENGCNVRSSGWLYVNKTPGGTLPPHDYGHWAIRISNGIIVEKILVQP
jgi:hypothetical protein